MKNFLFFFVFQNMPQWNWPVAIQPQPPVQCRERIWLHIVNPWDQTFSLLYTFLFYTTACNLSPKESLVCTEEGSLPAFLALKGSTNMVILKILSHAIYIRSIVNTLILGMGPDMEAEDYQWVSHHYFYRSYLCFI